MSVQALTWAFSRAIPPEMNPTDRFVLVCLANFADDQGRSWPSLSTIARSTNFHRGTVTRAIDRLENVYGAITKLRGGGGPRGRSNVYKLSMAPLHLTRELKPGEVTRSFDEASHDELLTLLDADEGSRSATPGGAERDQDGKQSATPHGTRSATPATGGVAENDPSWSRSARRPVREPSENETHACATAPHHDDYGDEVGCSPLIEGCTRFAIDPSTRERGRAHLAELREQLTSRGCKSRAPEGAES